MEEELKVAGQQQRGEAQPESSGGIFSAEIVAGSAATGNQQQVDNASSYLSAKGFKSTYPFPAEQLAELNFKSNSESSAWRLPKSP